jgi:hypothetical protein
MKPVVWLNIICVAIALTSVLHWTLALHWLASFVVMVWRDDGLLFLQNGLADKIEKSRKQIKERKNRSKKIRGVKKNAGW